MQSRMLHPWGVEHPWGAKLLENINRAHSYQPDPALLLFPTLVFLQHLLPPEEGGRIIHNYFPHAAAGKLLWEPTQSRKVTQISPGLRARTGRSKSRERSRKASRVLQ